MARNPDMTMADRRAIQEEVEAQNDGSWEKIASENDYDHDKVWFWFLVNDTDSAKKSYNIAIKVIANKLHLFVNTEFVLSFIKLTDQKKIIIESIYDRELRAGQIPENFGLRPTTFSRGEYTVFDVEP